MTRQGGGKESMRAIFGAGQAWDFQGRPSSYWMGSVEYEWNGKVFRVQTEQELGTGSVSNYNKEKLEVKNCEELNRILHNMRGLEAHYKKIYEN